jgi:hypothetical protein
MTILDLSFEVINQYIHTDDKKGLSQKIRGDIGGSNKIIRRIGYEVFIYLHKYCGFHNDSKGPGGSYDADGELEKPITKCEEAYKHFTRPVDGHDSTFQSFKSYGDYVPRYKHLFKHPHYTDSQFERVLNAKHRGEGNWAGIATAIDDEIIKEKTAQEARERQAAIDACPGGEYEFIRMEKEEKITAHTHTIKRKIEKIYAMDEISPKQALEIMGEEFGITGSFGKSSSSAIKKSRTNHIKKRLASFYRVIAVNYRHALFEEDDDPFDITELEGYPALSVSKTTTRVVGGVAESLGVDDTDDSEGSAYVEN